MGWGGAWGVARGLWPARVRAGPCALWCCGWASRRSSCPSPSHICTLYPAATNKLQTHLPAMRVAWSAVLKDDDASRLLLLKVAAEVIKAAPGISWDRGEWRLCDELKGGIGGSHESAALRMPNRCFHCLLTSVLR